LTGVEVARLITKPPRSSIAAPGAATFAAIVDDIAKAIRRPRERILADVTAVLRGLAEQRLLEL
jgi:hypothetical protein